MSDSWFSSTRSTKPMMQATANEHHVVNAFMKKLFIHEFFEFGMIGMKNSTWIAFSPEQIALIHPRKVCVSTGQLVMGSVEIKTCVASSGLDRSLTNSFRQVFKFFIGDSNLLRPLPKQHVGQLLQQETVLNIDYIVFVSPRENKIFFFVVLYIHVELRQKCISVIRSSAEQYVAWEQTANGGIPAVIDTDTKTLSTSIFRFWRLVNGHVSSHGPFTPLKPFYHGSKIFYTKTKGDVDGFPQYRAILCSALL